MIIIMFLVGLLASVIGAICGIGGGVIIKPVLDWLAVGTAREISFLSSCSVLAMSCYSVLRSLGDRRKGATTDVGTTGLFLGIGAAAGGIAGTNLFQLVAQLAAQPQQITAVQSLCSVVIMSGTLVYMLLERRAPHMEIRNRAAMIVIGLCMGVISSFLGIGGGPINLVLLSAFFSMDTKTAAKNSLYVILLSQLCGLLWQFTAGTIPKIDPIQLFVMITGGLLGGIVGCWINRRIPGRLVHRLLVVVLSLIILLSVWNLYQSLSETVARGW